MTSNPPSFDWTTRPLSDIPCDDAILPFALERLDISGRIVRLGPLIDRILTRFDYPTPVARLVGEAAALTVLMATSLKIEGWFQLQARGMARLAYYCRFRCARPYPRARPIRCTETELCRAKGGPHWH